MLTLDNAGYRSPPRIDAFSDSVHSGELLAIVGPNGAGKSTLLNLLSGFRAPQLGQVTLNQRPLGDWSKEALARRRAVVTQQDRPVFAWRVEELAALGASGDDDEVTYWLRELDLAHLAGRSVLTLSGGELQRVMIARALCQLGGPEDGHRLLLLDEPTSALDIGQQQSLMRLLRRLVHHQSLAVVCVLHDLNLAASFADRVWLLDNGKRLAEGPPAEVLKAEHLSQIYRVELDDIVHAQGHWLALRR